MRLPTLYETTGFSDSCHSMWYPTTGGTPAKKYLFSIYNGWPGSPNSFRDYWTVVDMYIRCVIP